ncbi:hypothetical protein GGR04_004751 [Aureimonas pseudogalii]|uniref:Transposase IS116/IS110/IS902 C-terminal domain-containing protein n=1 Tax=Aureimonas pseudogalii TaxID=1744844 RepID=A0A7W6MMH5_9HYPH|nr:IS110 family transposase [Aureimonas pseudogalii]MBB4000870.1 hypothetical protein [Aureimonas pseudogalii]
MTDVATQTIALPGLSAEAEIRVDCWGIPHIRAENDADLFFLQGFNAARDRLRQIDLWRKRGLGLLAADFGPGYLAQDHAARHFLYRGDMNAEWRAYGVDTQAICEAARRPTMRFVAVKSEEQQASALVFRTRNLLVRQRTQLINAIRGHLTESGWVAPKGPAYVSMLNDLLDDELGASLPPAAVSMFRVMLDLLADLDECITALDKEIAQRAREQETARRLMTIPGIGPITATALMALAPAAETFAKGRDFAAWLGLTPSQHSTGGKQKLGATSKMGERTLRRLLIIGASAVIRARSNRLHQRPDRWQHPTSCLPDGNRLRPRGVHR